jgi:CRP/FNR family transcriptional regulator, cyclic AMP receptor protein
MDGTLVVLKTELKGVPDVHSFTGRTMETGNLTRPEPKILEDALFHLPRSKVLDFRRKQVIFTQGQPSTGVYLVIVGKVTVCRASETGRSEFLLDIYQDDEFFGESALIGLRNAETAIALEDTKVMSWTTSELERIAGERPKLAIALMQIVVQRSAEFGSRIEMFATNSIRCRLARALIRFSDRFGDGTGDSAIKMMPFTHEMLSQYVGTSREIVTQYMKQFRRDGYVRHSRKEMVVYVDALKEWLRQNSGRKSSAEEPQVPRVPDAVVV